MAAILSKLRVACEDVLETDILDDTICRYRHQIKLGRIKSLVVFNAEDWSFFKELTDICSLGTNAHNNFLSTKPGAKEVIKHIENLSQFRKDLNRKRENFNNNKAHIYPPLPCATC